jgi:predicted KAP-like P-loop ATPase
MWHDNSTDVDFLNFSCVAKTAAELIRQADGQPLSLGVSGGWGAGKSSMLSLISKELHADESDSYVFVNFNAWLYQGYDDARAALMDVIAQKLVTYAEETETAVDKAKGFLKRVKWLRVAGIAAGAAASVALGIPPLGLAGTVWSGGKGLLDGDVSEDDAKAAREAGKTLADSAQTLLSPQSPSSPPQQIQDLRDHFKETLSEMGVTLVVFIDDLDRCLPATAISTLEAIRLFLFMEQTAFVIAADDRMIRESVRAHFYGANLDDNLITNYFDKLIQIPLRVPPLGTQDVRAYMMLLFIMRSSIDEEDKERTREAVCQQLSESWKGGRVDSSFIVTLLENYPEDLRGNVDLAERLAPLMTSAQQIGGNPRLIKQFLNTLSIRLSIAEAQNVPIDESALAKILLFERCASEEARNELFSKINESETGKPDFLREWEEQTIRGDELTDLPSTWRSDFIQDWLGLEPALADIDLRGIVYISREHLPIITPADSLSSSGAEVMTAILELTRNCPAPLLDTVKALPARERKLILDRLLVRARQEGTWGTPNVLFAIQAVCEADDSCGPTAAAFFESIPGDRLQADIIPALNDSTWARSAINRWETTAGVSGPVKKAIVELGKD